MRQEIAIALILSVVQTIQAIPVKLGYNPDIRPFYAPKPIRYPEPIIRPITVEYTSTIGHVTDDPNVTNGQHHATDNHPTTSSTVVLHEEVTTHSVPVDNRFDNKPSTPSSGVTLNYVPSRPFYAPDWEYPQQLTTKRPLFEEQTILQSTMRPILLVDKFGEQSTTTRRTTTTTRRTQTVPNLSYVPSRPPYAPNPVIYPQQVTTTHKPQSEEDKNAITFTSDSHSTHPVTTPSLIQSTTLNYYDDLIWNLQQLLGYVQELQKHTTPSQPILLRSGGDSTTKIPEVSSIQTFDINKIADAIKPLFTTTAKPAEPNEL